MTEFSSKAPLAPIPRKAGTTDGSVLGSIVSAAEPLQQKVAAGLNLQTQMEACIVSSSADVKDGKQPEKSSRLRGRLEFAKEVDTNFSDETEENDLFLDEEEYESLKALGSFMSIPALRLGVVKPHLSDGGSSHKG